MSKITAQELLDAYGRGSGTVALKYEDSAIGSPAWGKGWDAVVRLANERQPTQAKQVPRIIHEAYWKKYYQWADGLEAVLKSERVADLDIQIRLNAEYTAACIRLDSLVTNIEELAKDKKFQPEDWDWSGEAARRAVPPRMV